jgi:hypothetical protein
MFNLILIFLISLIIYFYYFSEHFSAKNDIKSNISNKDFFKTKPIDPFNAQWDEKIDYCKKRFGTLDDVDLNETLLDYKPKVILY